MADNITINLTVPAPQPVAVSVTQPAPQPVNIAVTEAPPGADGEPGTQGPAGPIGPQGQPGSDAAVTAANVAAVVNGVAEDSAPVDGDFLPAIETAAGSVLRRVSLANLWVWIKGKLDGVLTIAGAKTFTGQVELTGQSATNPTSAATRNMVDDALIWSSRTLVHSTVTSGTIMYGGSVSGTSGNGVGLALATNVNSSARVVLANNWMSVAYSGASTSWNAPWKVRFHFMSILSDDNSVMRVWTGDTTGPGIGLPYNGADSIPAGMSSIGFEFRRNPGTSQHQIRLIARDGTTYTAGAFATTNDSPVLTGVGATQVTNIANEIAAGRTVFALSGNVNNVAPDAKLFADGTTIIAASGTSITLSTNALATGSSTQVRVVYAANAGAFVASEWVNIGANQNSLNKHYDVVLENLGNGTARLYGVGWDGYGGIAPAHDRSNPILTLNGCPSNYRSVMVNASSITAHAITNGVNAPPAGTANGVTFQNTITSVG